ncbi:MAG: penicillin-binding transpeptidase domain-containing protein [Candidatus Jorgensenbacteria bacterium]
MKKPGVNLEDILADHLREDDLIEVPLSSQVFRGFWAVVLLLAAATVFQLLNLAFTNHDFYRTRSLANMSYSLQELAPRGIIFDRFGVPLVTNDPVLNVFLVPHELPDGIEERAEVLEIVTRTLGLNKEELESKLKEKDWHFSEKFLLKSEPDHTEIATLESNNFPGVRIESSFSRVYRDPKAFSHVLGFVGLADQDDLNNNPELFIDDEVGKAGIEVYYDSRLRGENGREVYLRDALGDIKDKEALVLGEAGEDLKTFIDADFQEYFYNRLAEGLRTLGRSVGVGIALNPKNGEVLALFNIPGVDASDPALSLNDKDRPFFNRAISGLYTPGSTIKPLHATAALSEGVISPEKQIFSKGFIEVPNPYNPDSPSRFLDWKAHGWVDVRSALARSSNVYFYEVGGGFQDQLGLGIERLREWWQKFGLNEKTGIDLPGEESGFLPTPAWKEEATGEPWRLGDTYNISIGQGDLLITPLELLNFISAIAADGVFYKPRVADLGGGPEVIRDLSGEIGGSLQVVQEGMRDAVQKSYGTAVMLDTLPINVAAKTGTSQVLNNEKLNAFFVGYAPYEDPEIAVLILVEDAREGSLNTVPIAYDVFLWYYKNRLGLTNN